MRAFLYRTESHKRESHFSLLLDQSSSTYWIPWGLVPEYLTGLFHEVLPLPFACQANAQGSFRCTRRSSALVHLVSPLRYTLAFQTQAVVFM